MGSLEQYLPEIVGYLLILTVAPYLISININALWAKLKFKTNQEEFRSKWHPDYLGRLDLILYLTAFLIGRPEFIIAWLSIKAIPQIVYWTKIRTSYNFFLIGNALIIISAFVAAEIIRLIREGKIELCIAIGLSLILFNLWTYLKTRESGTIDVEKQKKELGN